MVDSDTDAEGLWLSVSELARLKGRTRQALSKRVASFEARGLIRTRPGDGDTKLVNVAEFDRAASEVTDLSKEAGQQTRRATSATGSSLSVDPAAGLYTREQARRMGYQADLARIELEERLGQLVPVADVASASQAVVEGVAKILESISSRAEENAAAVANGGVAGSRSWLKQLSAELRTRIAAQVAQLVERDREAAAATATPRDEELTP